MTFCEATNQFVNSGPIRWRPGNVMFCQATDLFLNSGPISGSVWCRLMAT